MDSILRKIRSNVVQLSHTAQSAHVGSSLSVVETLACLFKLRTESEKFRNGKIVLSKGHAAMALYATAIEFGDLSHEVKDKYLKDASTLWGHPSVNEKHDFIHWSTGSLGHGLPVSMGFAYAKQIIEKNENAIFSVVLSDGELNEGSNWEAILFAGHHKLKNVLAVIDYNKIQSFGFCQDIMQLEPLKEKFESFSWGCIEVDGHNTAELMQAMKSVGDNGKPLCIIAHTIKGKGIAEYEGRVESHYKPISKELFEKYGCNEE